MLEAGGERERGICAARMTPHHAAGIAHKAAQLGDGTRIGLIEIAPRHTFVPGGDGTPDRRLVEGGRALQQAQLGLGLHRAREHQRVVAVRDLKPLDLQTEPEAHVIESNPPALEPEILERATDGAAHVEGIGRARMGDPRRSRSVLRDETIDITVLRRQVEWHHHGAERPQILDPCRLFEKRREVVISKNEDRMLRHMAREYHGVRPRLVRLVRDAIERREVEHVPWSGGHDPVETARLHGVKQTIEVAKALRQRHTRERIGGRGGHCVYHTVPVLCSFPFHALCIELFFPLFKLLNQTIKVTLGFVLNNVPLCTALYGRIQLLFDGGSAFANALQEGLVQIRKLSSRPPVRRDRRL